MHRSSPHYKENGRPPAPPAARLAGGKLVWNRHNEPDVIGYRVYQVNETGERRLAAAVKADEATSFSPLQPGVVYCVIAVDIAGQESAPSPLVSLPSTSTPNSGHQKSGEPSSPRRRGTWSDKELTQKIVFL
ncbi:hypothetical protein LR69_02086 [Geobacillus sp. BCO2]|nr:hypothetical protein LR69_02086 [Geobacillus sp. BCO2]